MKRWHVTIGLTTYKSSLLSMDAKLHTVVVRTDHGKNIIVRFPEFFDFAQAKAGEIKNGTAMWQHGKYKKSCTVIFK